VPQDTSTGQAAVLQDLGDGLVMRRATPADRETLAYFHANTLLDPGDTDPDERMRLWMLDLMSGQHPTFRPGDFCLVEDTRAGKIVSSVGLISQMWTYEGTPLKFGQPEIVSTDPAYRRRGLVRAQFNEVHRWSAERGELVQGITGIPWYYRQFGYEMALDLGGRRVGSASQVPALPAGESEPFVVRPATVKDVPFICEMYGHVTARSAVATMRGEAIWRYDIAERSQTSGFSINQCIIETPGGEAVGALVHSRKIWGNALNAYLYELRPGVPFLAATPAVMRYLRTTGEEYAADQGEDLSAISFNLGGSHPVYDTISNRLAPLRIPDAWYIRVPNLPAFLSHIAPALEKRLAESPQNGYTGQLKVNFYRSGIAFAFDNGRISVEAWKPDRVEDGEAAFPDLTFLQLLFGFRSLEELQHAFPDCSARTDEARALLPVLFPKKNSHVWAGG
jgi:hypothetical protein